MSRKVFVAHCIDTEGPLYEPLEATFRRIDEIFGVQLEPTRQNLRRVQNGEVDELGKGAEQAMDPKLLRYNDTWDKIDDMLESAMSESFREEVTDSQGNGWIYSWFCVDHVDYETNPRRRTTGYHEIFDHYRKRLEKTDSPDDGIQFHFHPHPPSKAAHRSATHWWANSNTLYQVLSRRIIDRNWFPAANRPGFHVTRPDSHWFLEQFIPFDYANQAVELSEAEKTQKDLSGGRFGDWRRAPKSWAPYHPSHDDYQRPGSCRRWIARCLNVGTRHRLLDKQDIQKAFEEASNDKPVVLAFTNHDFRDIRPDVNKVRRQIQNVSADYPGIEWEYAEAVSAMQKSLDLPTEPAGLELTIDRLGPDSHRLRVGAERDIFGPQPYLAYKTKGGTYYHDNFDIQTPFREWTYVFDVSTFQLDAIEGIGVAANNESGITEVLNHNPETNETSRTVWNAPNT
jgi:hypothetical protein